MAKGIWLRVIRYHRIAQQATTDRLTDEPEEALGELCHRLDLPRPLWLDKNRREWAEFGQTRFLPDAFFEPVSFERLEVEYFDADAPKRRSDDPRND